MFLSSEETWSELGVFFHSMLITDLNILLDLTLLVSQLFRSLKKIPQLSNFDQFTSLLHVIMKFNNSMTSETDNI